MIPVSLQTLAAVLDAELIGTDCTITEVTRDTRQVTAGCLFVALKGERFDAHDFAADAVAAGAGALLEVSAYWWMPRNWWLKIPAWRWGSLPPGYVNRCQPKW